MESGSFGRKPKWREWLAAPLSAKSEQECRIFVSIDKMGVEEIDILIELLLIQRKMREPSSLRVTAFTSDSAAGERIIAQVPYS